MDSPESRDLAAHLKSVGFRFVGPVVAHSFMQTVGIENGHFDGCFRAALIQPARRLNRTRAKKQSTPGLQ